MYSTLQATRESLRGPYVTLVGRRNSVRKITLIALYNEENDIGNDDDRNNENSDSSDDDGDNDEDMSY